ncbi:hypothetical protein B7463_g6876, partial [Scytalidium lignicola]
MNQDLETDTLVDNNNEQQPEEGSEEGFEEESEEGSEEVSEESSEDNSEEDQEEVVMLPKQTTRLIEGSTVRESSRAAGKKPAPPLPKPDLKLVLEPRAPSLDPDLDFELEDDVEQVLMVTFREVKIVRPDLFYGDRKKLKAYLVQTRTYLVLNDHLLPGDMHKVLWAFTYLRGVAETWFQPFKDEWFVTNGGMTNQGVRNILGSWENYTGELKRLRKSDGKKDYGNLMELNAIKKRRTFKGKGKKHFEGRSKKGNSFGISSEELDKRRKNKLCFKCGLPGHMANTHKKDNKSSAVVKVGVMRIPRIMDILLESSDEEGSSEEDNSLEEGDY